MIKTIVNYLICPKGLVGEEGRLQARLLVIRYMALASPSARAGRRRSLRLDKASVLMSVSTPARVLVAHVVKLGGSVCDFGCRSRHYLDWSVRPLTLRRALDAECLGQMRLCRCRGAAHGSSQAGVRRRASCCLLGSLKRRLQLASRAACSWAP